MATQKQTEKQGDAGGKQQALARQGEPQLAATPTTRRLARTNPVSLVRRMLDDLDTGMFGWRPTSMMRRMLDDMERVFESDFFADVGRAPESAFTPRVDVRQRDDKLVVSVDLPGVTQDRVEISAQDDCLIIEAERPRPSEEGELWQSERSYGRFRRVITLPEGVDTDNVVARFENGVLEISLPLPPSQTARRIPISTGAQREERAGTAAQEQAQQAQPAKQAEKQPEVH